MSITTLGWGSVGGIVTTLGWGGVTVSFADTANAKQYKPCMRSASHLVPQGDSEDTETRPETQADALVPQGAGEDVSVRPQGAADNLQPQTDAVERESEPRLRRSQSLKPDGEGSRVDRRPTGAADKLRPTVRARQTNASASSEGSALRPKVRLNRPKDC